MSQLRQTENQGRGCLVIAAPHSGSGKTCLTIGLLRALSRRGVALAPAKIGPDYIDPQFHQMAAGVSSMNIDGWAMRGQALTALRQQLEGSGALFFIEGVMGLFDGAVKPGVLGHGATADIARAFNAPVILVVDCAGMGQSVAALVKGFQSYDPEINLAGVILNKLGSLRHIEMMQTALEELGIRVLGAVPRHVSMDLPSRHLGLVQAGEIGALERQISQIADWVEAHVQLDEILEVASRSPFWAEQIMEKGHFPGIQPPGQHVAVARDEAFAFFYPHLQAAWQGAGVSLSFFSPLDDQPPTPQADAIFLPGGYPELYAGQLAGNETFFKGLKQAAAEGKTIYGECGGYMVLGEGLVDKEGDAHQMAGLLAVETSFEKRHLHLGYRYVRSPEGHLFRGHEFHYSTVLRESGAPLFRDVEGEGVYGLANGSVSGSFVHLIDQAG